MSAVKHKRFWLLLLVSIVSLCLTSLGVSHWVPLPNLTFEDVSSFSHIYEGGIACLQRGECVISLSDFLVKGVFWIPVEFKLNVNSDDVASQESTLYLEILCYVFNVLLLIAIYAAVSYILWLRYVNLLRDGIKLLFKTIRQVDWHTPVYAITTLCKTVSYIIRNAIYYWSQTSHRDRYFIICCTALIAITVSIRLGIGRRRFCNLLPLGVTWFVYVYSQKYLSGRTHHLLLHYVGSYYPHFCTLLMLRHCRMTWRPHIKFIEILGSHQRIISKMSYVLDLFVIHNLLEICCNVPLVGGYIVRHNLVVRIMFYTSLIMTMHWGLSAWLYEDYQLGFVKPIIVVTIDSVTNFIVGWPNIISSRIHTTKKHKGLTELIYDRLGVELKFSPPFVSHLFSRFAPLAKTLRWIKLVPHLIVLLLPRVVLSLYVAYLTLLSPLIRYVLLPYDSPFTSQMVVAFHFIIADVVRSFASFSIWAIWPLRGLMCILLPILMGGVQHLVEDLTLDRDDQKKTDN
ncbi:uncharacterized protein BBOV_IV001380 [Babesia bovis T2Bo]|uniref:Membrane protein, putative n=1 Tax=Babesia bovis TaxID=5865 RepID=A7AVA9_BABBO|nr:uncharacterized protein BBOV_IV001380 [Babesia bovis T2Bo]EDO05735.1 putative integral membrane protein [Babesia bovis T2Bo]|eukprot:XP_001609303.1 hypothetical protein [Babesia bovis T2Bo]